MGIKKCDEGYLNINTKDSNTGIFLRQKNFSASLNFFCITLIAYISCNPILFKDYQLKEQLGVFGLIHKSSKMSYK